MSSPSGVPGRSAEESKLTPLHRAHDHHKAITMADIAKAAGVSQGAISSLLNDRDYGIRVSDKTRERVFRVCREMGYMPNDLRAVVRMYPELGDICVLLGSDLNELPSDPFQARIINGVMKAVADPSRPVTLARYEAATDYNTADSDTLPYPVRSGVASKYLCVGRPNPTLCQALVRRNFGVSVACHDVPLPGVTSLLPDYAGASETAISYLFSLGHKRLAILSGPFGSTEYHIIELNRGVRAGYEKVGVPIEAQNIIYGDLSGANGYQAADLLLDRPNPPTAIFCFDDAAAAGVIARAQERGVKLPQQLSVLGCSDDVSSAHLHPALSTIHLPAEGIGAAAVEECSRRVDEKESFPTEAKKLLLPVKLIERESCSAPAA